MNLVRCALVALIVTSATLSHAELKPCEVEGLPSGSRCGTISVPLRYDDPASGTTNLGVVVLPARNGKARPDPVFFLAGGPGTSTTASAGFFSRDMTKFQQARDLVLVDLRGTGQSSGFDCRVPFLDALPLVLSFQSSEAVSRCAESIDARDTLRTEVFARDLDQVRRALGVEQINLLGASYGTRLALEYARLFPEHVRTMTLRGVTSPDVVVPSQLQTGALHELQKIEKATPGLLEKYGALVKRLDEKPITVSVAGSDVTVDGGIFEGALRFLLYDPKTARSVPGLVEATTAGVLDPLAQVLAGAEPTVRRFSIPVLLGVLCSEDVPFWKPADSETANDTFRRNAIETCESWSVEPVQKSFKQPVTSRVPTLLLSGEHDPATPPNFAEEIASHLESHLHLVSPGIGHFPTWTSCYSSIITAFLEHGELDGLDTSCAMEPPR